MATLKDLPVACAHLRGNALECAIHGTCQPAHDERDLTLCADFHRAYRKGERAAEARAAKPRMSIDDLAAARRRCREAKAKGLPCGEFTSPRTSGDTRHSQLGATVRLNLSEHFNPGLIEWRGELLLASRKGWRGEIWLSRVGDDLQPTETWKLPITHPNASAGVEDPRLFACRGRLHVACSGYERGHVTRTSVLLARIHESLRAVERVWMPRFSGRSPWEKNWQFFEHDGELLCVYLISPHVILRADGDVMRWHAETHHALKLPHGPNLRGGAPPVRRSGEFFHWFHTQRVAGDVVEYGLGLYTFDAVHPFAVRRAAKRVLLWADSPIPGTRKSVVFPCGAILRGDDWLVSYGHNDAECRIITIPAKRVENLLEPV